MLHVFFDNCHGVDGWKKVSDIDRYFDENYDYKWMNDPFVKRIVKEIDNSEAVQDNLVLDYQGIAMGPNGLSTGCKTLILLFKVDKILVSGDRMGDNCYNDLIFRIAEKKDIYITLSYLPKLPERFDVFIENFQRVVHTWSEYVDLYMDSWEDEPNDDYYDLTPEEEEKDLEIMRKIRAEVEKELGKNAIVANNIEKI